MAKRFRLALVFTALCFFSWLAIYPLLRLPSWYYSHEFDRYLYLIIEFRDIFTSGQLYPRWASSLMNGYGYPTFLFYQPGYFFYMLPLTYLPMSLPHAIYFGAFIIFLISGIGAYRLARLFGHDRLLSTLFGAAYIFMPYAYTNLYIRGDYSEFLAMMLCSWVMYGVFRLYKEAPGPFSYGAMLIYILSLTAVFYSHPHVTLFLVLIIVWFVLVLLLTEGVRSRAAHALMLGGVAAATLSAPYWFVVLQMSGLVNIHRARRVVGQAVTWLEMLVNTTPKDVFPWIQSVGIINIFFLLMAMAGLRLLRRRDKALFWQLAVPLFIAVAFNTHMSLRLWHAIPSSSFVQFSWRIASVAGILILVGMMQLYLLKEKVPAKLYRPLMLSLMLGSIFLQPYIRISDKDETLSAGVGVPSRFVMTPPSYSPSVITRHYKHTRWTFANHDEFTPRWVDSNALNFCVNNHQKRVEQKAASHITGSVDKDVMPYIIRAKADVDATDFPAQADNYTELPYIFINQLFFPGWTGSVNGEPIVSAREGNWRDNVSGDKDEYGRMRVFFPRPGHYELEAYYDGPPYWLARNIAMLLLLVALYWAAIALRLVTPVQFSFIRRRAV